MYNTSIIIIIINGTSRLFQGNLIGNLSQDIQYVIFFFHMRFNDILTYRFSSISFNPLFFSKIPLLEEEEVRTGELFLLPV